MVYFDFVLRSVFVYSALSVTDDYSCVSLMNHWSGMCVCVCVSGTRRVECMDLFSRLRRKLTEGIQYPFAMVSYGGKLYYTDWRRSDSLTNDSYEPVLFMNRSKRLRLRLNQSNESPPDSLNRWLCFCFVAREAVVAMERQDGMEVEEFLPQRRSRTYGITITYPQCPAGLSSDYSLDACLISSEPEWVTWLSSAGQNYCSAENGGCSHLCLPRPGGFSCRCPDARDGSCVEPDQNFWATERLVHSTSDRIRVFWCRTISGIHFPQNPAKVLNSFLLHIYSFWRHFTIISISWCIYYSIYSSVLIKMQL